MINIDQVRKQDLRPLRERISQEQIKEIEGNVNFFAFKVRCMREIYEQKEEERRAELRSKFDFWK